MLIGVGLILLACIIIKKRDDRDLKLQIQRDLEREALKAAYYKNLHK